MPPFNFRKTYHYCCHFIGNNGTPCWELLSSSWQGSLDRGFARPKILTLNLILTKPLILPMADPYPNPKS